MLTKKDLESLPKIELHDHLDGGLRTSTMIELAKEARYNLPATDEQSLVAYIEQNRNGSLPQYLSLFAHTVALMSNAEAISRIACEMVEDWAREGIVYGEARMAPELFVQHGLSIEAGIEAILAGLRQGEQKTGTYARLIVCALRHNNMSIEAAKAAAKYARYGVVGFDIAGPEEGFSANLHRRAFELAKDAGLGLTVHAGEASGIESVESAMHDCFAQRLGHGVRIKDHFVKGELGFEPEGLALEILQRQIGIEVCLSSNIQTKAVDRIEDHPARDFLKLGFRVNLNTDNRLISNTNINDELILAHQKLGFDRLDLATTQEHALAMIFDPSARQNLIDKGFYQALEIFTDEA